MSPQCNKEQSKANQIRSDKRRERKREKERRSKRNSKSPAKQIFLGQSETYATFLEGRTVRSIRENRGLFGEFRETGDGEILFVVLGGYDEFVRL